MTWLGVALLSGAVAGVGFWRGSAQGLASQTMPALAGAVFSLLMFRATTLSTDRQQVGKRGGAPLRGAGALSLTAAAAAAVDVLIWFQSKQATFGAIALPLAAVALVVTAISALRLSANSPKRTHFYLLALVAIANAAVAAFLFVNLQFPRSST